VRPPVDLLELSDQEYSVHEWGGEPAVEILEFAADPNADTVILGVNGRLPVGKVLFGSLAQAVLIDSHRPVTVSRNTLQRRKPAAAGSAAAVVRGRNVSIRLCIYDTVLVLRASSLRSTLWEPARLDNRYGSTVGNSTGVLGTHSGCVRPGSWTIRN